MGGITSGLKSLSRNVRSAVRTVKRNLSSGAESIRREVGDILAPDINVNIPEPEKQPVMPIPDEELSRTARRRARARRKGGRSSSILTGGDSLGGY